MPVAMPSVRLGPTIGPAPLGLVGITVSRSERIRTYRPELVKPVLSRGLAEVVLRPLVSGFPAEYHLCRHSAFRIHRQHRTISVLSAAGQAVIARRAPGQRRTAA
jgi:hypothetical protein